jgi:hypothetical protein
MAWRLEVANPVFVSYRPAYGSVGSVMHVLPSFPMLALSRQQCPAFISASAAHVLHGPRHGLLYALYMLSAFLKCVLTGCLSTPETQAKGQGICSCLLAS